MDTPRARDAERRVAADPWDADAWMMLSSEAERVPLVAAKPVYERLVTRFPPVGRFWLCYAQHVARDTTSSPEDVIAVYQRAVTHAPTSIDLWRNYLTFISSRPQTDSSSTQEASALSIYEDAIKFAGLDLSSNLLWVQFIDFVTKQTSMSDSQRRDYLRRVYQRAVRNPMQNLEQFWNNYVTFENANSSNKDLTRSVLAEYQTKNNDARAEYRARRSRREGLTLLAPPLPPRGRNKETSQAQQWRRFIAHERTNPFQLPGPDLHARVIHAFETALSPMYRYPDFWLEYLAYVHTTVSSPATDANANANVGSAATGQTTTGGGNGSQTSGKTNGKDAAANSNETQTSAQVRESLEPLLERAVKALPESVGVHVFVNSLYVRIGRGAKGVAVLETLCQKHASPLAFIHLMRAVRRQDGRDAARKAFGKARKDPKASSPNVYVAAALMEFSVNKDSKVARNVFEFGLKNFPKNAVMALHYVNWLWGTGDVEYARVVLRTVMPDAVGTEGEVRQLWERWLELEETVGDVSSVDQVVSMWKENGVGRTDSVVDDVLRMSRCLGYEGLDEVEIATVEGVRGVKVESNAGGGGSSGGGKRDPRTGRRVGWTGGNKDGTVKGGTGRKVGESGTVTVMKTATEWLQRMANSLPKLATRQMGVEGVEIAMRMVMNTPESFSDTPVGRSDGGGEKRKTEQGGAKKRKAEEIQGQCQVVNGGGQKMVGNGPTVVVSQTQDVFRARQAAKQSRLR